MRPFLVICSNEDGHYRKKNIDLAAVLSTAVGVPALVKPLDAGDYALVWARDADSVMSDDPELSHCCMLIERKTLPDFENSFLPNADNDFCSRYKDQADRLRKTNVPYIYWVITPGPLRHPENKERIRKATKHLEISYANTRTSWLESGDLQTFATELRTYVEYLQDTIFEGNSRTEVPTLVAAQRAGAKLKLDAQPDVFLVQLTVPRGMSHQKAAAVRARYSDMAALMRRWRERRDEAHMATLQPAAPKTRKRVPTVMEHVDMALEDVPLENGKRLGPAMSKRLRECIVPDLDTL